MYIISNFDSQEDQHRLHILRCNAELLDNAVNCICNLCYVIIFLGSSNHSHNCHDFRNHVATKVLMKLFIRVSFRSNLISKTSQFLVVVLKHDFVVEINVHTNSHEKVTKICNRMSKTNKLIIK